MSSKAFGFELDYKELAVVALFGAAVVWFAKQSLADVAETVNKALPAVGNAVNPVNPDNIFNSAVQSVGETLSGDPEWNLFEMMFGPYQIESDAVVRSTDWYDNETEMGVSSGASGSW